jgi:hypothetical protein
MQGDTPSDVIVWHPLNEREESLQIGNDLKNCKKMFVLNKEATNKPRGALREDGFDPVPGGNGRDWIVRSID